MPRTMVLSSVVSAAIAVIVMLLMQRVLTPQRVAAQSSDLQEVRASAFTLVGPDGTTIGRWQYVAPAADGSRGGGVLNVYNNDGKQRVKLNPNGIVAVYDLDGTTPHFLAGYISPPVPGPTGNPPVNGLQLDSRATIDYILGAP